MKLRDVLNQIFELREDHVIFVREPWTLESDAEIGNFEQIHSIPNSEKGRGLTYFLEAHIALEVLEVFADKSPTPEQISELLLFYATNDSYPLWVYELG